MKTESMLCLNPNGYHRLAYQQWGDADNDRVVVCVHGLARNSRDFDELASLLSAQYRVVCPDIVGRGQSDWLPGGVPYGITQYMQDMVTLIARLNVSQLDWVGTSMGGLIGIALAAYPESPIHRLVLNDIGAFVSRQALQRIASYVGLDQRFDSVNQVERMLRQNYPSFRGLDDHQWQRLARHGSRCVADGRFALHYDPRIGEFTRAAAEQDIDLWAPWQGIKVPQLVLWGKQSDVLSADTVSRMQQLNANIDIASWDELGHAPSLMEEDQIKIVCDWLAQAPR